MPDFGSDVSTIYDKEPFERELSPKEQEEADERYAEDKNILVQIRYHLDQADSYSRWHLNIENDIRPDDLEDAFVALAAAEKELEK
ncbi:MAG TPA: hypothetical protein ENI27_06695 [bacterium]|nr:hypothetical protein [bacterium]